jgi:hypothetical protein
VSAKPLAPIRFVAVAAAALLAFGFWRAEIVWMNGGWYSLEWLEGFNWAAVPICVLIAGVCAFCVNPTYDEPKRLPFVLLASGMFFVAFAISRQQIFDSFSVWSVTTVAMWLVYGSLLGIILCAVIVSAGLTWLTNRFLAPVHDWISVWLVGTLILILPISCATIRIAPEYPGVGVDSFTESIKRGYPAFWTALLVPLVLQLGVRDARHSTLSYPLMYRFAGWAGVLLVPALAAAALFFSFAATVFVGGEDPPYPHLGTILIIDLGIAAVCYRLSRVSLRLIRS